MIEKAVRAAGAEYFDGGAVVGMPDQPDKVHLSAHEHELLGKAVAGKVREMMADSADKKRKRTLTFL